MLLANERLDADVDLNRIAEATDSFSGSDLNALCTAAAMIPVRELLRATGKSAQVRALLGSACAPLHVLLGQGEVACNQKGPSVNISSLPLSENLLQLADVKLSLCN